MALENCETVHNTRRIQRGEGCACDSVDFCPFLQINKISLYLHTNSIAKPPKKIIYREKNNCKKHFCSTSQVAELPLIESRWLGRWIDPPANETSLERDSDSGTKNSARMSCYFRRRSNNLLVSNYSSSAGADGLKNFFLKKFWKYLRIPLHKNLIKCFRLGRLTDSFRSGTIKLIPKKGDATNKKNWRPISQLNCVYKVISRAINNRLKTIPDKITSRVQKGFTRSRQLPEALINIIENIAFCKTNNVAGTVVAIDQAKAFDCHS